MKQCSVCALEVPEKIYTSCPNCGSILIDKKGLTPSSTEPSTVDFEREAELEFPYYNNLSGSQINSQSKRSYNYVQDSKREGYIKGRKTTSQEGLRELVDWMENGTWVGYKDDLLYFIIAKANEILNR